MPLHRTDGQELPTLPGLLALNPPRRAARGRERDHLVVFLALTGNAPISTGEYIHLAAQTGEAFYQAGGSLTSALRAAAETLNQALLERNMRTTGHGQYTIGHLVLGALRDGRLFLLLSGQTHVFWVGRQGARHIHDAALSGKGLGMGPRAGLYYAQVELLPGDWLLFARQVPASWGDSLLTDRRPVTLDSLYHRLMVMTEEDVRGALLQARAGEETLSLLRPGRPTLSPEATPLPSKETVPPSAYAIPPQAEEGPPPEPSPPPPEPETPTISEMDITPKETSRSGKERRRDLARALVGALRTWRTWSGRLSQGVARFLPRLLPSAETEDSRPFPSSWMAVIAIVVPLVVVTLASVVYFRYGHSAQYEKYFSLAEEAALRASAESDPIRQREAWEEALGFLNEAEQYRRTSQSQALRRQAQDALDALLGIARLEFRPALSGPLPSSVQVAHMAATDNELYLLDATQGLILRAALTGRGYQVDLDAFQCAPGFHDGYQVGRLVDLVAPLPAAPLDATVMGVDALGNLLYCAPGQEPKARPLVMPAIQWGRITAIALDGNTLYVLDTEARAVWIYRGQEGLFEGTPIFFFSEQVPPLEDVVDIAVREDDLYLLHADGHLTRCTYSDLEEVPTRCQEPIPLTDPQHPANQEDISPTSAHFTRLMFNVPPDRALLLLDAEKQSVYRLSPGQQALEIREQLRPFLEAEPPFPSEAIAAMAVSPNHTLFFAVGGQIYQAGGVP
ncbi:MAG: hypothetical protein D6770_09170 [Anaerolineae bacterium]|nr:MAG: hypothetical protein D6770_09170 [Anaerolineae bacterium]